MDFKLSILCIFCSLTWTGSVSTLCPELLQQKLDGAVEENLEDGSLTHDNVTYPNGTHWKTGEEHFGCPCLVKHCVRTCSTDILDNLVLSVPKDDFRIDISNTSTELHNTFHVIREAKCSNPYTLEPESSQNEIRILENGTLLLSNENQMEIEEILDADAYCIAANGSKVVVLFCISDEELAKIDEDPAMQFPLYPIFMMISVVFLVLTLVSYFVSPAFKNNLLGKCVAFQSLALIVAFICLSVSQWSGVKSGHSVCTFFAFNALSSQMGAYVWLNVLCFEIFWSIGDCEKIFSTLNDPNKKRFRAYSIYTGLFPLVFVVTVIVLENVLDEGDLMKPGFGFYQCWFGNRIPEWIFHQGPLLVLLILNTIFFITTLYKKFILKREFPISNADKKGYQFDEHDRNRLMQHIKLFVLMNVVWMLEFISFASGGSHYIWLVPDLVHCSLGLFFFYFCVWSDIRVRYALLGIVSSKYKQQALSHAKKGEEKSPDEKMLPKVLKVDQHNETAV